MGETVPLQTAVQEHAGSSVSFDYQATAAGQGLAQVSDVAMDKNTMKWDHLTVADVLVNGLNQLPELKTEIRPNAGAMATYDYINDKTDQKCADTMKWTTTMGELSMSKLSWSVWDWNDPKGNDVRDDVCIGSADGPLLLKKIREGRTNMSETITFDNLSFDNPDKKKVAGKVTIVLNIQVMETTATTPNPSKDVKRIITAEDKVEVSIRRIETNELPHVKSGGPGLSGLNKNNVYLKLKLRPNDSKPKPPPRMVLSVWDHNISNTHTKIGSVEVDVAGVLKDIRAGNRPSNAPYVIYITLVLLKSSSRTLVTPSEPPPPSPPLPFLPTCLLHKVAISTKKFSLFPLTKAPDFFSVTKNKKPPVKSLSPSGSKSSTPSWSMQRGYHHLTQSKMVEPSIQPWHPCHWVWV